MHILQQHAGNFTLDFTGWFLNFSQIDLVRRTGIRQEEGHIFKAHAQGTEWSGKAMRIEFSWQA